MSIEASYTDLCTADTSIDTALFLALRPVIYLYDPMSCTFEEHRASGNLGNSAELHIMAGLADEPPCTISICNTPEQAMAYLSATRAKRPSLCLWYDGQEQLGEIKGDPRQWLTELLETASREDEEPGEENGDE